MKGPFYDKGTPTCPSPWPDEPIYIDCASPSFALKHGGELTRSLVYRCKERGYFEAETGLEPQVCVRATWQDVGEYQHHRDAWHFDNAKKGWIYIDGCNPTEVRFALWGTSEFVPLRTLFPYHGLEHRCPRQTEAGWRYFFRVLHAKRGGRKGGSARRPA